MHGLLFIVGRLTNVRIDKLQTYYGLAIRRNTGNLEGMRSEIMAGLNHSASSNASPNHNQCPQGDNSWCKYNIMLANRELYIKKRRKGKCSSRMLFQAKDAYPDYEHICTLPDAVVSELTPIYERLSKPELLDKCLHGLTQNACESFNYLVWQRCPKEHFSGQDYLDFAIADAVVYFNDGKRGHSYIFPLLGLKMGLHSKVYYEIRDSRRISASIRKSSEKEKKIRQAKRSMKKAEEDRDKQSEGTVYKAGDGFDQN